MRRRDFILAGTAVLAAPHTVRGQRKTPVIGLLWNDSVKPSPSIAIFVAAMRDRGYALDRDFRIEDRVTLEGYGGYAENAADLVRNKVDLIVINGTTATMAAAKATKEIPIVAIMGVDPVAQGLAASLARPGGNVTGIADLTGELTQKRIALIKELVPGLRRVGVVLAPNVANPIAVSESEAAARVLNLQLQFVEVAAPGDIEGRIEELVQSRVGAIYVPPSSFLASHSARMVAAIAKHRIPALYAPVGYAEVGGLVSYSASASKRFVRLAGYVDRILKGARAAELPIEQTTDFELVVNLKAAKALGIKVPQSILVRADRVIE
ncbi:MAG: ABC transporter substrate-binding protein [Burkholderiales bacterium]